MMQEIKRTKVKTYSFCDTREGKEGLSRTADMFTVHLDKRVAGLRIVVMNYEDGETKIKLMKGDGRTASCKEFFIESLNDATTEQIEAVITEMKKENLK